MLHACTGVNSSVPVTAAIIKNDVELTLMQRKPGGCRQPTEEQRRLSKLTRKEYAEWFRQFCTKVKRDTELVQKLSF